MGDAYMFGPLRDPSSLAAPFPASDHLLPVFYEIGLARRPDYRDHPYFRSAVLPKSAGRVVIAANEARGGEQKAHRRVTFPTQ